MYFFVNFVWLCMVVHRYINKFYTFWRKVVRQIWKIPYNTNCYYLPHICDSLPIEVQIVKRFCKFLHQVMKNDNVVSIPCGKLAFAGSASSVCNNINYTSNLLKSKSHDLCSVIKDCIIMKYDRSCLLTCCELQYNIKTLCTE